MKKIIFLILFSIFIFSCSWNKEQWIIKESGEIVNDYVNTLEWSIKNTKEVKDLMETNQNKLLENLNSIK